MLLEDGSLRQEDAALGPARLRNGAAWQLPWRAGSTGSGSGCETPASAAVPAPEPCPPAAQCNCSAQPVQSVQTPQPQRRACRYGEQPGIWRFPPELEPNVTLWDSKYEALDSDCEPQPLVQHYIAVNRAVHNSTGPTQEVLAWSKKKVRDAYWQCRSL